MNSILRKFSMGMLALCGATAMAQNAVTILGNVSPCNGTPYPVWIFSDPGTVPAVDTVINTTVNCTYAFTFHPVTTAGGITAKTSCDGGLTWGTEDSLAYNIGSGNLDSLFLDLSCGESSPCEANFTVQQAMGGGALLPWQITTTNISSGQGPLTYSWLLPDGSISTAAEPTFTFTQAGEYGICLTISSADSCTAWHCDSVVVDTSGMVTISPVWYDCLGVPGGTNTVGSPCDDGDPMTLQDQWDASCTCAGHLCVPVPDPLTLSGGQLLTVCSNSNFGWTQGVIGIAPPMQPVQYAWTGPGLTGTDSVPGIVVTQPGTYHVTVSNACSSAGADFTLTVVPAADAGMPTAMTLCSSTAPFSMFDALNGTPDAGGTWTYPDGTPAPAAFDPATMAPGGYVYVYTVPGTPPCANATDTLRIIIDDNQVWYADADGDGLGDPSISVIACEQPAGYVGNGNDACPDLQGTVGSACDDGDPLTFYDAITADCVCAGISVQDSCHACFTVANPLPWTATLSNCSSSGSDSSDVNTTWWLPDGSNSTNVNESWTFNGPGTYAVCLAINDGFGCSDLLCDSLYVGANGMVSTTPGNLDCLGIPNGPNVPGTPCMAGGHAGIWSSNCTCVPATGTCQANFWAVQAYDSVPGGVEPIPNEVWVWNLSTGGNGNYQFTWDFGDGSSSTEAYPVHEYDGNGPWLLCLTMTSDSCTDTYCDSISVDANGILNGLVIDGHPLSTTYTPRSGGFTLNVISQVPTGIREHASSPEIRLWPNPVSDALNLTYRTNSAANGTLAVIDQNGRTVLELNERFSAGANHLTIPAESLVPGLYLLRINTGAASTTGRFLKMR